MRIRLAIPDKFIDAETLNALLEATTRAGQRQLERGDAPDVRWAIKKGLKWKPEAFKDGEHFDLPATANGRGWGDCDDLAPWLAATLRATGEDPNARPIATRSGPSRWHIRTELSDGRILDPSRWAGMGAKVSGPALGVCGMAAPPIALPGDGSMMMMRDPSRGWWGRCDLPWADAHLASVAPGKSPAQALERAVCGALDCADGVDPLTADYAARIAHDLLSHPYKESLVAELIRAAHKHGALDGPLARRGVVGQFDLLGKMAGGALGALGGGGGGGGGGAPPAGGGGGGPIHIQNTSKSKGTKAAHLPGGGHIAWQPQGPIIVRF